MNIIRTELYGIKMPQTYYFAYNVPTQPKNNKLISEVQSDFKKLVKYLLQLKLNLNLS